MKHLVRRCFKSIAFLTVLALLVSLVPMWCIGNEIFSWCIKKIEQSSISTQLSSTRFFAQMLQNEMIALRISQYECITNENVRILSSHYYGSNNRFDEIKQVRFVQNYLRAKTSLSSLIEEMILYFPQYGKRLSSSVGFDTYTEADNLNLHILFRDHPNGLAQLESQMVFFAGYPFYIAAKETLPSTVLVTHLSNACFKKLLHSYADKQGHVNFAIGRAREGKTVASTFDEGINEGFLQLSATNESGSRIFECDGSRFIVTWAPIKELEMTLYQIVPRDLVFAELMEFRTWINNIRTALALTASIISTLLYLAIYRPNLKLRRALHQAQSGDLTNRLENAWSIEFQDLFDHFHAMESRLQAHIEQEYKLRLLVSDAELKQLQYQISPHFLYNTYYLLRRLLTDEEYDKAVELASLLGAYLKYIVRPDEVCAPLHEEVAHARAYSGIQQMRFSRRMRVDFGEIDAKDKERIVPRLVLQPLIENAFAHGLRDKEENGLLRVRFGQTAAGDFEITVEDNGEGLCDERLSTLRCALAEGAGVGGVALCNIDKRVRLVYGAGSGLSVCRSELGGMKVSICLKEGITKCSDY